MMNTRFKAGCLAALAVTVLAGCSNEQTELQDWMREQRQATKPKIEPISAPTEFEPEAYAALTSPDPFSNNKLLNDAVQGSGATGQLLASEAGRRRQPLEEFPLDQLAFVGTLQRAGKATALIRVGNTLYDVKPGDYMGQNYGRVVSVNATELVLREIVPDATGDWAQRTTTMQLQETNP